jgi:hypothetical protein
MTKLAWVLYNSDASVDFTSSVQSFTYTQGRRSVLDNYGGGTATITMRNNTGQVAGAFLAYRQKILIKCQGTNAFTGWVQGIDYNDTPGNANDATATITLGDAMVLAGQQIATNYVLTDNTLQITEIGLLQFYTGQIGQFAATSSIQTGAYSGDWATRLNQIVASDRGKFRNQYGIYYYVSIPLMGLYDTTSFTFGRTPSASVIAYSSLDRIKAIGNQTYVNQAQVTPQGLALQTATASIQSALVGTSAVTVATLNTTVTDGMNTATWIANSMADPEQQSFSITCSDIAQTSITNLASLITYTQNLQLAYTPPGGVSTSEWVSVEGLTVRASIDRTEIDFNLASLTYYRAFILDNAVYGVLDSSRLGY